MTELVTKISVNYMSHLAHLPIFNLISAFNCQNKSRWTYLSPNKSQFSGSKQVSILVTNGNSQHAVERAHIVLLLLAKCKNTSLGSWRTIKHCWVFGTCWMEGGCQTMPLGEKLAAINAWCQWPHELTLGVAEKTRNCTSSLVVDYSFTYT
jgi:hypothetical protein